MAGPVDEDLVMRMFVDAGAIYLHRDSVDFRKSINGLVTIVEQEMQLSPFAPALFVFCNRNRDRVKVLYWDQTGFCLWYKRLEKEKFKWPLILSMINGAFPTKASCKSPDSLNLAEL